MIKINLQQDLQKTNVNVDIVANITEELNKLIELRMQGIDEYNKEEIHNELMKASSIIEDVHVMGKTETNNFKRLQFAYTSLSLDLQKYEIEQEIEILGKISRNIEKDVIVLEEKLKDIQEKQKELTEKQEKAEERNNNLVYNLLGFLTAFSIVSAVVGVVASIKGVLNIMIFMAFTILVLLTTLIGLHNFYENNNNRETRLQDNYFLWKVMVGIIIFLIIVCGGKALVDNKETIITYFDNKIEQVIEDVVREKMQMEELEN